LLALRRHIPGAILRFLVKQDKFLTLIEIFHFNQAARFVADNDDASREIHGLGFDVHNYTPFAFSIVGASIQIKLDSVDLQRFDQRFPREVPVTAYSRSGFHIQQEISEALRNRLRKYPHEYARLQISGHVIFRTPYGELQKEANAAVAVLIHREMR